MEERNDQGLRNFMSFFFNVMFKEGYFVTYCGEPYVSNSYANMYKYRTCMYK